MLIAIAKRMQNIAVAPTRIAPVTRRVRDIMTASVLTIGPESDLRLAIQMMLWGGCRHLPVLDGDGRILGVLTEHDVHRAQADGVANVAVVEVMRKNARCVSPDTPVPEAAALMADERISSILVVDDDRLAGILTSTDILANLARQLDVTPTPNRTVSEVMCRRPKVVEQTQTPGRCVG